ncbi:MAG: NmrA family transcriptional regulator [Saccharothrix sp.]|nr:NmrA family transcriptional regulator [Saccharothrix sp.]
MKIVVIGGDGPIGRALVSRLGGQGHRVVLSAGVDGIAGASAVVDVSSSPSGEDVLAAAAAAGVGHYVTLSVVGADRLAHGDFRVLRAREALVGRSGLPYTIVRATRFLVESGAVDDVAEAIATICAAAPRNGTVEVAGSEQSHESFLHDLEATVRAELAEAEAGRDTFEGPVEDWLVDPTDVQRYEAGLRGLLGAVEAVEDDQVR